MTVFRRRNSSQVRTTLPLPPRDGEVVEIVPMRRRDVRTVVVIEREIFPEPWSQNLYLSELAQKSTRRYYVALASASVVGYAGCILVAGECHVTTIGVAPEWQGCKIGARLLYRLVADARHSGAESVTLEVRLGNATAQRLYQWFGFAPVGIRKNYYTGTNEDALVMHVAGVDSASYGARLASIAAEIGEGGKTDG
jgi:[ribosomal protein S18]-alanine N-acetyltransferase